MASTTLITGEVWNVSNNNSTVYGNTGNESVTVNAGVTGLKLDQSIEGVSFTGATSAYTYQQQGMNLVVYSGTSLVATIPLQADADGTQLSFSNGTVSAVVNTTSNVMTLGGSTVTAGTTAAQSTQVTPVSGATTVPTFSVTGATAATEGTTASFVVSLAARATGVNYSVTTALAATGTAVAGTDFNSTLTLDATSTAAGVTLSGGVLTIPASSTVSSVTLSTAITSDTVSPEAGEGLTLSLSSATGAGAVIGTSSVTTTITDVVPVTGVTLTTGTDALYGTAGNDTFTADILTLGANDSVVDTSTADADVITVLSNANIVATTTITNVETLNLTALGALSVDMTKITGVKAFNETNSTGAITITGAPSSAMALGLSGASTNNINATYTSGAIGGTADKLTVNLSSATAATVAVNAGFETAELNVTGPSTLTSFTTPGVTALTISGTGTLTVAANGLVGVTDVTLTDPAAIKLGAIATPLKTFTATANTGGITGSTALNSPNIYSTDAITGASTGLTVLLGSGADNFKITDTTTGTNTNTIKLGDGADKLEFDKGAAGATYIFGEAGDDSIKLTTTAVGTSDYIDGGAGTDTLTLDSTKANTLVLNSIENITLTDIGSATTTVNTASGPLAITAKLADTNAVNIVGLTAGSTVTTAAATAGNTFIAGAVTEKFASTEAANTINVAGGMTGILLTDKITNLTVNLGAASDIAGHYSFSAATDVTINATGSLSALTGKNVVDPAGPNTLKNFTTVGTDIVKFGTITSTVLEKAVITATNALTTSHIGADSEKLTTVNLTSTADTVTTGSIGKTTDTNTLSVNISAKNAITNGGVAIESTKIGNVVATSTLSSVTLGAIGSTATTIGDITVNAKGNVVVDLVGNNTTEVATSVGTISLTSTTGSVALNDVNTKDAGGINVYLTAATTINDGAGLATIKNVGGNITATLAGDAGATINYLTTAGLVNLTATNTGGLTTTVTNAGTAGSAQTSTITLGNAISSATNALTVDGTVDTINITGGTGTDTVAFGAGDVIKNGTITLGSGTADQIDFSGLAITNTKGLAMNFSSDSVVFGLGSANTTTLLSGKVAAYDAANYAGSATATATALVASGQSFTVSGVEKVIGTGVADYIASSNTGMIITGGAAADKIKLGAASDSVVLNAFYTADTLTDFTSTSDKLYIDINNGAFSTKVTNNVGTKGFATVKKVNVAQAKSGKVAAVTAATKFTAITKLSKAIKLSTKNLFTGSKLSKLKAKVSGTKVDLTAKSVSGDLAFGRTTASNNLYMFVLKDAKAGTPKSGTVVSKTFTIATVGSSFVGTDLFLF